MAIVCWGNLAKSANDTQRIEQAIMGYVETHDENPNAHMGPDYALGAHRLQVELDHLPYSVLNKYIYPQSRTYKAIVDPAGYGENTTIQSAIDYVNGLGGGSIFIKAGTYTLNADLTLYSNIQLIGEDDDTTILNFSNTTKQVLNSGGVGAYKRNISFQNLNFANGENVDGLIKNYYVDNVSIRNCKFTHSAPTTTNLPGFIWNSTNSSRIFIQENRFLSGTNFILPGVGNKCWITENYFYNSQRNAIIGGGSSHLIIRNNVFENIRQNVNFEGVIYFDSDIVNLHIEGNQFINCKGSIIYLEDMIRAVINDNRIDGITLSAYGIYLVNCMRCVVTGNNLDNFDYDGIFLTGSDKNDVVGNAVTNCDGFGVNIYNNTCDKNVVVGNVLTDNISGSINDAGTGTVKDHNAS